MLNEQAISWGVIAGLIVLAYRAGLFDALLKKLPKLVPSPPQPAQGVAPPTPSAGPGQAPRQVVEIVHRVEAGTPNPPAPETLPFPVVPPAELSQDLRLSIPLRVTVTPEPPDHPAA